MQVLFAVLLFALGAPLAAHTPAPEPSSTHAEYWVGPAVTGSWFDPARSGEGIVIELLEDGSAALFWFTYPPEGEPGDQAWMFAISDDVDGDTIRFDAMRRPQGARFGAAFDPDDVVMADWGSVELQFHDCGRLTLRYQGPTAFGDGQREMVRLTAVDELDCGGQRALLGNGARALDGLRARSGAWFDPARSGEGWILEDLADGRTGMYWFTFDAQGRQMWIAGIGRRDGSLLMLEAPFSTRGTRFGEAFDSTAIEILPFGGMQFDFADCNRLQVSYAASDTALGAADRDAIRLTRLAGLPCIDGTPASTAGLGWSERRPIPGGRQSELAATVFDGEIHALGGFGDLRGFKRYSPGSDSWTALAPLPDGRHHLAAFALDGSVYFVGGESTGPAQPASAGYRFDIGSGQWSAQPGLLPTYGSQAAVLHGRAFVGDPSGWLQEFDPRNGRARRIPGPLPPQERDHAQLVAFMGEIWVLGGRFPETPAVAIYDPVSETWRDGPFMRQARGGFAAAVVGPRIVVAGGELIGRSSPALVAGAEVYTVGTDAWIAATPPPVAVHGSAGAGIGHTFYMVGGSTIAGSFEGGTGRLFSFELPPP